MRLNQAGAIIFCAALFVPGFAPTQIAAQAQSTQTSGKLAARADERPQIPSALGRYVDGDTTLAASKRGSDAMGGGMDRPGRWHLTIRRFAQPNPDNLPESKLVELAREEPAPTFEDSGSLIEAFTTAMSANAIVRVADMLGLKIEPVLSDAAALDAFIAIRDGIAEKFEIEDRGSRKILLIGESGWPFPYAVARDEDGKWAFDTQTGLQEIVNRRVGENELRAVATARAYLDAQREYASRDRDGDEVREYAQRLTSSDGKTDGLYWPADQGDGESPGGEFLQAAQQRMGYHGYRLAILTAQGDKVPGGAHDYVINGNMIAGFALLAWPTRYGESGLHSFVISHHGTVYETDLGAATDQIVPYIERIDPGDDWRIVED